MVKIIQCRYLLHLPPSPSLHCCSLSPSLGPHWPLSFPVHPPYLRLPAVCPGELGSSRIPLGTGWNSAGRPAPQRRAFTPAEPAARPSGAPIGRSAPRDQVGSSRWFGAGRPPVRFVGAWGAGACAAVWRVSRWTGERSDLGVKRQQ